ncbi:MAG: hypothetical protein V4488_06520 [Pseudomonadota bacterium]
MAPHEGILYRVTAQHLDLMELEFEGSYDQVVAFAMQWKVNQIWQGQLSKQKNLLIHAEKQKAPKTKKVCDAL